MASDDMIEMEGVVEDIQKGVFLVRTEMDTKVSCHLCGKMRTRQIRVVLGDKVTIEVSPYDLAKGRITFRHKD